MPSKQPSNPPQPDITRTIEEILIKEIVDRLGIEIDNYEQDCIEQAVHKLVTLVETESNKKLSLYKSASVIREGQLRQENNEMRNAINTLLEYSNVKELSQ